jgi:hypothetical protein
MDAIVSHRSGTRPQIGRALVALCLLTAALAVHAAGALADGP